LVPVVLSVYVATVNMPLVSALQRRRVPLGLTVALVLSADAVLLAGFSALLVASAAQLSERLPDYFGMARGAGQNLSAWLGQFALHGTPEEVLNPGEAMRFVASLAGGLAGLTWDIGVALIIAAFLLMRFGKLTGDDAGASGLLRTERGSRTLREVNRYVVIKTGASCLTGILIGGWTWLVDGELPILFGVMAFLLNYIPSLGSVVVAVPAIAIGLLTGGVQHGLLLALGYGVTNLVIGNVLEPRMMGRALGLWPVVVLLSVIFWGWLLGLTGALLSALLTVILKMLLLATVDLRPFGLMLGPRSTAVPARIVPTPEDLLEETLPQT
jgi:predicted PurR-regulated permease PerM